MTKAPQKRSEANPPKPQQAPQAESHDIVEAIKGELVDVVPKKQIDALSERIGQIVISEYYSGPLPHPRHLSQYDQIIPNGADRVMNMAESSLAHNQSLHGQMVTGEIKDRSVGMWMGFASFVILVLCALIVMMKTGSTVGAGLFLAAAAVNVVGMFIKGRGNGE